MKILEFKLRCTFCEKHKPLSEVTQKDHEGQRLNMCQSCYEIVQANRPFLKRFFAKFLKKSD